MSAVTEPQAAAARDAAARRRRALAARAGLLIVAAIQAEVGVWGLIAPRSLFNDFPGAGRHWIAALGPYNEHLVRDYAGAELGLAVLLVTAAVWFERRLVLVAGIAFLASTVPHFIYHLTTTGSFSTGDDLASLGGFVLEIALVGIALSVAARAPRGAER
jgi:hypothetical protein